MNDEVKHVERTAYRDTFESHDSNSPAGFGDSGLFHIRDVCVVCFSDETMIDSRV